MAGEKRAQDNEESIIKENVVIVDIEGTTTSISFVKDKLFPYVRENLKNYVDTKWEDEEFKNDLEKLKEQAKKDEEDKIEGVVPISGSTVDEEKESLVKNVIWQMDGDRKTTALKQLQGHMWREAYDSGKIKGHVYEDVPESLKSWKKSGKKIYVYSSGSVDAQKLLFGHSEHGDLLEYFSGHFDTAVGAKQEAASYKNILSQINTEASEVIFLTDIVKEARAAKEAGISSIIMIREGNAPLTAEETVEFRTAKSFLDLPFLNPAKRQKLETPEEPKKPAAVEPAPENIEDVEMTDVSDKDSKSKDEAKPEAEESKEKKTPALETVAEKDEAMETDGKTVEAVEEIGKTEEPKEAEETAKIIEKETEVEEKVEESKPADETDRAKVPDVEETEITEKPVEIPEKKAETEEKPETVPEIKTETKTEGSERDSEPSKNDKIENETENGKSDLAETKEVEKKEPKEVEDSEKTIEAKPESKETVTENGTSKTDETSKTDTEVEEKVEDSKIAEEAAKEILDKKSKEEDQAKKEIVAAEAKKDEETNDAGGDKEKEKEKETESKEEEKTEIAKDLVGEPEKKLNGTTQNGESGKTAEDGAEKIHTNGVNEPCTSESTNTSKEVVSQQNREAESSTEPSSDSIKVKKVVDSTVADGAGEQDVVTPAVAVAATS